MKSENRNKKTLKIKESDFEKILNYSLGSSGLKIPTTIEEVENLESQITIPPSSSQMNPSDILTRGIIKLSKKEKPGKNLQCDNNFAQAAREGKTIPKDVLQKMKKDRKKTAKR